MPNRSARLSPLALLLALALVLAGGCTRQAPLQTEDAHILRVDWGPLNLPRLEQDGLIVQGLVFTPAQWPLEASARRLLAGDWTGVVAAFDLSFRSGSIPDGVLQELYDLGYVPALVRVVNPTADERPFALERLVLELDGRQRWPAADARTLPTQFVSVERETVPSRVTTQQPDRHRALMGVVVFTVLMAALLEGRLANPPPVAMEAGARLGLGAADAAPEPPPVTTTVRVRRRPLHFGELELREVLLRSQAVGPGAAREGLVFFPVALSPDDWRSAALRVR